jgi:hypothetical protein
MLDVTNLNIPPTAFTEVVVWKQKREHKNLWKLRKMYRKKSNDELAIKIVSQYSQVKFSFSLHPRDKNEVAMENGLW